MGLQQREQDLSLSHDLGLSEEAGPSTSPGIEGIPQPPSPVPTEIDDTADSGEQPGKSFRSFLGLDYGPPQAGATPAKDVAQPSTPKKRRLTPPTGDTGKQPDTDAVPSGAKLPLTPPQTTHRTGRFDKPKQVSSASSNRKGKERERVAPEQAQDQVGIHLQRLFCIRIPGVCLTDPVRRSSWVAGGGCSATFYESGRHTFVL